jgi:hypothetical protein
MTDWNADPEDDRTPLTRPNLGAPTGAALFKDGHWRETCPDFTGVGIMIAPTLASTFAPAAGAPIPVAVVVCSCGVIRAVPLK